MKFNGPLQRRRSMEGDRRVQAYDSQPRDWTIGKGVE